MRKLMCIFAIIAAVVFAQPLLGQMPPPAPKPIVRPIPSTLAAKAGKLVSIPVDGDFDVVSFVYSHKDFPPDQAIIAPRQLTLVTGTNGIYSVTVVTVKDKADKQSLVTITITGGVDPGPTPPPPEPDQSIATLTAAVKALTAVVTKQGVDNAASFAKMDTRLTALEQIKPNPPPTDPLIASLQAAYVADGKPAAQLVKLANIYQLSATITGNPANTTPSAIFAVNHKAIEGSLKEPTPNVLTILTSTRRAIGAEMDKYLPLAAASTVPLTDATRANIDAQFQRIAKALQGVQP